MLLRSRLKHSLPTLSVERALYLAKEAGVFTTKELQTHFVKSPSFSVDKSPFLLEDFFSSMDDVDPEPSKPPPKAVKLKVESDDLIEETESADTITASSIAQESIHSAILRAFRPEEGSFFVNEKEFKKKAEGKGTRKRAVAHAIIIRGTGQVRVNGEEDIWKRWPLYFNRFDVLQPFLLTKTAGQFDLFLSVKGGGLSGQSCAARLAVSRALVSANSSCSKPLRDCLFEDTRQKVSKSAGRNKAFARDKNKR